MALNRALAGVRWPCEQLAADWAEYREMGAAEPYIVQAVCALLIASGHDSVLETGSYVGLTSAWLALTLEAMGGGHLTLVELDKQRAELTADRLDGLALQHTQYTVANGNILDVIPQLQDKSIGLVWIDDDHAPHHVEMEVCALWPKMKPGGVMTFHDVVGITNLQTVVRKYGGVSFDFPRIGPAGGLGIIAIPGGN